MKPRSKAFRHSLTNAGHAGAKKNETANRRRGEIRFNALTILRFNLSVPFTLHDVAAMSGGELRGAPKLQITAAATLAKATSGEISFFVNRKYIGLLRKTRASAVFVPPDFAEPLAASLVRGSNPAKAFEQVVLKFAPK